jgi:hypothetical protein
MGGASSVSVPAYKESGVTLLDIAPLGRDQVDIAARIKDWAA